MNKKLFFLSVAMLFAVPAVSSANIALLPFPGIISDTNQIFNAVFGLLWPVFAAYAIIMFIVAGFQFLNSGSDPGKAKDALKSVMYGAIGVAVALLAFSIPLIVKVALGV